MTTFTLAGGCFWCLDAVFRQLKGVKKSETGYTGGTADSANYYTVASGATPHAESVRVTFDDNVIGPEVILDLFFTLHDPTTLNRQGADVGTQYRSAMFHTSVEQKRLFEGAKQRAETLWNNPLVTEISPLDAFYLAEPEHQDYFANNPANPYCQIVINPKLSKVRQKFATYIKEDL